MNRRKKKVLILYDYFSPAYRAGGPTQSLVNLVRQLHPQIDFFVICGSRDHGLSNELTSVTVNRWIDWDGQAKVYYWRVNARQMFRIQKLVKAVDPDYIFINGLYSFWFNILPLMLKHGKIILSVRGMLHQAALNQKSFKKRLFLNFFKWMNWHRKVAFHATDEQEKTCIRQEFGDKVQVAVAGNFPNEIPFQEPVGKIQGQLNILTIALVSPMKNHQLVLESLRQVSGNVRYKIYGPIKDSSYWKTCMQTISALPSGINVEYCGELSPDQVASALAEGHVFVLPSQSENFGHSIFEALSAGRPVITSDGTPWKFLHKNNCGYTLSLNNIRTELPAVLQDYVDMNEEKYAVQGREARNYIEQTAKKELLQQQYLALFN